MSVMGDEIKKKIHTHRHDIRRGICSFLMVLVDFLTCSMKGRSKRLIFWMVGTTRPCPVKGFERRNRQMKGWNIVG